jgi:hypothetical protein
LTASPSATYDWSDIYHLTTILANNSFHAAIQQAPTEVLFGRKPLQQGPFGLDHGARLTSRLLQLPGFKDDVDNLKKVVAQRIQLAKDAIAAGREVMRRHYNRGKQTQHQFHVGQIVFVKNFSLAPPGVNIRLRPSLYKSPFVVTDVAANTAVVTRLTDAYSVQLHVDYLTPYKEKSQMFKDLPTEVVAILGAPLTEEALLRLAEVDELPLIFLDRPVRPPPAGHPVTRAEARRRKLAAQEAAAAATDSNSPWLHVQDDDEDDEDVPQDVAVDAVARPAAPTVRFAPSTPPS